MQGPEAKKERREDGQKYRKAGIGRTLLALMGRTNNTTWNVCVFPNPDMSQRTKSEHLSRTA